MLDIAKRVLAEAGGSEQFWRLSDSEKLIWMIRRAGELGKRSAQQKGQPRPRPGKTSEPPR